MDVENIFKKPGREWEADEIQAIFTWLIAEKLDSLIKFTYVFTKDLELSEEIVIDKFLYIQHHPWSYDPARYKGNKCPFNNFLFTIVSREAVRRTKRKANRSSKETQLELKAVQMPPVAKSDIEIIKKMEWDKLQHYIEQLPSKYKEAIELCVLSGMSRKEAGKRSKKPCSEPTMRVRLYRAQQQLIGIMKKGGIWNVA